MIRKNSKSPDYAKPPVTEVVIGVQFNTIESFTAAHLGLYWQRLRDSYPNVNIQPPLSPVLELFGDQKPAIKAKLSSIPPVPRCWFLDDSQNRLVQIQPDRFLHNWKKVTGREEYPRYKTIRENFKKLWNDFSKFVESEKLGQVKTNQWELTYVNYIHQNDGWLTMNDLPNLFPCWLGKSSDGYLPVPENITFNVTYAFPEKRGRLHISLEPSLKMPEGSLLLRLTLTARGRLEASDTEGILNSLDIGHEWIVRGFTDFTTSKAHKMWERKDFSNNA
jgi:uncharacterized protein (TIGR04255 family)